MKKGNWFSDLMDSPDTLLGIGLGLLFTAVIEGVKIGKKIKQKDIEKEVEKGEPLTAGEKVKHRIPYYLGLGALTAAGTFGVMKAYNIRVDECVKWSATAGLLETTLATVKSKTKETVGEGKAKKIADAIAKEKSEEVTDERIEQAIKTGKGDTLFMDGLTGQLFYSDWESVRSAANDVSHLMLSETWVEANELLDRWGLTTCKAGSHLGFNIDDGLIELYRTSTLVGTQQVPCCVIQYDFRSDFNSDSRCFR